MLSIVCVCVCVCVHACLCSVFFFCWFRFFWVQVRSTLAGLLGEPLSGDIEAALFNMQDSVGALYKRQWRAIVANLTDSTNDLKSAKQNNIVLP